MSCDLLREGAPIEPVPPVTHWKPDAVVRGAICLSEISLGAGLVIVVEICTGWFSVCLVSYTGWNYDRV